MARNSELPNPPVTNQFRGRNGTLIITDTHVVISREGVKPSKMGGFYRGDKTIPYSSIVAVTHRKADRGGGYMKLTLLGGPEEKGGRMQGIWDENSLAFDRKDNAAFLQAKALIEERIIQNQLSTDSANSTATDNEKNDYISEIERLAVLCDKGIITSDEFNLKKDKLLGM